MSRIIFIAAVALVLAGCDDGRVAERYATDQCLRASLFQQCLKSLPAGPQKIDNSNDWDEVVGACDDAAYWSSRRADAKTIKPECRS